MKGRDPGASVAIPAPLAETVTALYGQTGEAWLAALPQLVGELAGRWGLTVEPPFAGLSYNYVAPAVTAAGEPAVLKVGVPNRELATEMAALQHYAGRGAVRLLASDAERGALLLERLRPGTMLAQEPDDERARYVGLAKTRLQHIFTALGMNVLRLGAWWAETPHAQTRVSSFSKLAPAAAPI